MPIVSLAKIYLPLSAITSRWLTFMMSIDVNCFCLSMYHLMSSRHTTNSRNKCNMRNVKWSPKLMVETPQQFLQLQLIKNINQRVMWKLTCKHLKLLALIFEKYNVLILMMLMMIITLDAFQFNCDYWSTHCPFFSHREQVPPSYVRYSPSHLETTHAITTS